MKLFFSKAANCCNNIYKNLVAMLLGFVIAVLCLLILEGFFQVNERLNLLPKFPDRPYPKYSMDVQATNSAKENWGSAEVFKWRNILPRGLSGKQLAALEQEGLDESEKGFLNCCLLQGGYRGAHEVRSIMRTKLTKQIVYDAQFHFDEYGRRRTPVRPGAKQAIVALGDSFTLGEGVNDEESYPFQLGLLREMTQIYNLGLSGSSVNEVLFGMSRIKERLPDLQADRSLFVYTYMDAHLDRLLCPSTCFGNHNWIQGFPYYAWDQDHLEFRGSFLDGRPLKNAFYRLWSSSALLRYFKAKLPVFYSKDDFELFVQVVLAIQESIKKQFPGSELFFALYPGQSHVYGPQLAQMLSLRGVKVLDYSRINVDAMAKGRATVPVDHHPSPIAHYIYAQLLNRDLPIEGWDVSSPVGPMQQDHSGR